MTIVNLYYILSDVTQSNPKKLSNSVFMFIVEVVQSLVNIFKLIGFPNSGFSLSKNLV